MSINPLQLASSRFQYSTDPSRADYACPAYREMLTRWALVEDIRSGPEAIWAQAEVYLPRFEAEDPKDWQARVAMTFPADDYARTVVDHAGLVLGDAIDLSEDVPPAIKTLMEDVDGRGNHVEVFTNNALDQSLHMGHGAILTDYPKTAGVTKYLSDARAMNARPYATFYRAPDILNWRYETVGGVQCLVFVMLREWATVPDGEFGSKDVARFREFRQLVLRDENEQAVALGAISWRLFQQEKADTPPTLVVDSSPLQGPERIPLRVIYGGDYLGPLHTRPHLIGMGWSSLESTQVGSDYAAVMHKCNVPTPIFIGRQRSQDGNETVKIGQGMDLPVGGDAKFLEPSGAAIGATRTRLEDLSHRMQMQGAAVSDGARNMTATEAALVEKQRNAKLKRARRSTQDALEGMLQDFAAFMSLESGGSVALPTTFGGVQLDPAYLTVLVTAYDKGGLELPDLMYALKNGRLPDDMNEEESALRLLAAASADQKAREEEDARRAAEISQGVAA